jgi:hypothetical protein
LISCSDFKTEKQLSPSGNYYIFATVNRTDKNKSNYADVVLHLLDKSENILETYTSKAGDAQKWALGWMPNEDIVILQSSDVGDMAFKIEENKLVEIEPLDKSMYERAKQLYEIKYGS